MFKKQIDYSTNNKKYDSFNDEIEKMISPNTRVLDIGCATGKLAKVLKNKKCTVTGLDIDKASLRQAAKYCRKTFIMDVDDLKLLGKKLKEERFDYIICGDILEHLKYPGVFLYHMHKYLKSDGSIIASIPNIAFLPVRIKLLFGSFDYNKKGGLLDTDHLRFFTFKTARLLFEDANYSVRSIRGVIVGKIPTRYFFLKSLAKIIPTLFALHFIITAQKSKG